MPPPLHCSQISWYNIIHYISTQAMPYAIAGKYLYISATVCEIQESNFEDQISGVHPSTLGLDSVLEFKKKSA
jgi:hypothetical protein